MSIHFAKEARLQKKIFKKTLQIFTVHGNIIKTFWGPAAFLIPHNICSIGLKSSTRQHHSGLNEFFTTSITQTHTRATISTHHLFVLPSSVHPTPSFYCSLDPDSLYLPHETCNKDRCVCSNKIGFKYPFHNVLAVWPLSYNCNKCFSFL